LVFEGRRKALFFFALSIVDSPLGVLRAGCIDEGKSGREKRADWRCGIASWITPRYRGFARPDRRDRRAIAG